MQPRLGPVIQLARYPPFRALPLLAAKSAGSVWGLAATGRLFAPRLSCPVQIRRQSTSTSSPLPSEPEKSPHPPQGTPKGLTLQGYLRLIRFDRPAGNLLLLLPCFWGLNLAVGQRLILFANSRAGVIANGSDAAFQLVHQLALPPPHLVALFCIGTLVMRGAGCIINDMWDRDFDSKVERTKSRPLASGEISMKAAMGVLTAHMVAGLGVLTCFNLPTILVGAASLPLVVAYPLAKRFTYWPQLILGFTFNWGVLVGYSALFGHMGMTSVESAAVGSVYLAGVFWTLIYDTIYAHQDADDDVKVGVKSTALRLGKQKAPLYGFALASGSLLCLGGYLAGYPMGLTTPLLPCLIGSTLGLLSLIHRVDLSDRASCGKSFASNVVFGWSVIGSIMLANVHYLLKLM